jgi:hypothetical protein
VRTTISATEADGLDSVTSVMALLRA